MKTGQATSMDITEFLLARIAEDGRAAQSAAAGETGSWHDTIEETGDGENAYYAVADDQHMAEDYGFFAEFRSGSGPGPAGFGSDARRSEHIARWDPARVLAECEAKRRIVDMSMWQSDEEDLWDDGKERMSPAGVSARWETMRGVLAWLALPYVDHPDYDEGWRP